MRLTITPGYLRRIELSPDQPATPLECWCLITVLNPSGTRARHALGRVNGEGRYSTSLVCVDFVNLLAQTRSGRIYQFEGPPGMDEDALWICQAAKNARGQTLVRIHLRGIERLIALIKRTGLTAQRKAQC